MRGPSNGHVRVLSGEQLSPPTRVGYVAVPQGSALRVSDDGRAVAARSVNFVQPSSQASPLQPSSSGASAAASPQQGPVSVSPTSGNGRGTTPVASPGVASARAQQPPDLPPLQEGYEYQAVHFVSRDIDLPRVVEDPRAYRPGTPILNWEGPRRSIKPPKLQFWLSVTLICVITNVVSGIVPLSLDETSGQTFLAVWISVSALFVATFSYMSTTRHLQAVTIQMEGINSPKDIDVVLERLENGRFSRLEEIWKVQVHMIKMFCRLLRHHHGVPAVINSGNAGATSHPHHHHGGHDYDYDPSRYANDLDVDTPDGSVLYDGRDTVNSDDDCTRPPETDASMFSAVSQEMDAESGPPSGRAAHGSSGSFSFVRRRRHSAASNAHTSTGSPHTPGMGGGSTTRRPRLTNADPLNDNSKTWDEVLSAGGDSEGPSRSLFLQLMKQVKVGQDLSKIVLPVHILEPRSLLEKLSDLFVHPDLIGAVAHAEDATDRVKRLTRWFLSAYHMRPKGVKKPYNPVLGETFECVFARGTPDELWYFAEQVSHHPPITCFRALHVESKIEVVGSYVPRSKLVTPNTGASIGEGFFDVYIPGCSQNYRLGWPNANAVGILSAPLRLELVGTVKVSPRDDPANSVRAEIHFEPKPYFGGEHDCVRAGIFAGQTKYPTFVIKGKWHSLTVISERTEQVSLKKDALTDTEPETFFDPDSTTPVRPEALPTAFPRPSRLVWKNVTVALRAGDAKAAQEAKQTIETAEREIRRAREARGEEYVPGYFRIVGEVKGTGKDTWRYTGPTPHPRGSPVNATLSKTGSPQPGFHGINAAASSSATDLRAMLPPMAGTMSSRHATPQGQTPPVRSPVAASSAALQQ